MLNWKLCVVGCYVIGCVCICVLLLVVLNSSVMCCVFLCRLVCGLCVSDSDVSDISSFVIMSMISILSSVKLCV